MNRGLTEWKVEQKLIKIFKLSSGPTNVEKAQKGKQWELSKHWSHDNVDCRNSIVVWWPSRKNGSSFNSYYSYFAPKNCSHNNKWAHCSCRSGIKCKFLCIYLSMAKSVVKYKPQSFAAQRTYIKQFFRDWFKYKVSSAAVWLLR